MKILRPPVGARAPLCAALLAIFGFTSLCSAQFAEQVALDGAFAYWTMDDLGPGPATNAGSSSAEAATFNDNGQLEFGVPGLADPNTTAVRFKGFEEGVGAGVLNINNTADSNAGGPWTQKTIELWFSVDDAESETEQVLYEQGGSTRAISMYVRDGQIFVGAHNSNSDSGGVASPWPAGVIGAGESELAVVSTDIESETPYHLAFVLDGAAAFNEDNELPGTITGYLNGEEFGTVDGIGTLYAHTDAIRVGGVSAQSHFDLDFSGDTPFGNDGVAVGAVGANDPYFFSGVIDGVALYNSALSADRIAAHFDSRDYVIGDFDGNGEVEFADFLQLVAGFNKPGTYSNGDISFDGQVDLEDFSIFRRAFAATAAGEPSAASVPEPTSALMLVFSALALPMLRRSRNTSERTR